MGKRCIHDAVNKIVASIVHDVNKSRRRGRGRKARVTRAARVAIVKLVYCCIVVNFEIVRGRGRLFLNYRSN